MPTIETLWEMVVNLEDHEEFNIEKMEKQSRRVQWYAYSPKKSQKIWRRSGELKPYVRILFTAMWWIIRREFWSW